jgi:hypothetical protein
MKLILVLLEFFEDVYFTKPLLSKLSSSEKYVVCLNFKYNDTDKDFKKMVSVLETMSEALIKNKDDNVVGIFTDFEVPRDIMITVSNMNISMSNENLKSVGNIVTFIRNQVYSGEEYHEMRDNQIAGTKYWTELYLPKQANLDGAKNKAQALLKKSIAIAKRNTVELNKKIVNVM